MNLWAKSVRQLAMLAVALFFFSCEDETSTLGFKNPNEKFKASYIEIPLESSVLLIDSLVTDNTDLRGVSLVGQYQDNQMGTVRAESYLQVIPAILNTIPSDATFDSVTVQFRLNYYGYGFTGTKNEKFSIHEIKNYELQMDDNTAQNQYYNSSYRYKPAPIGQATVEVKYDTLKKYYPMAVGSQDTLLATARLNDNYGLQLFFESKVTDTVRRSINFFKYQFSGLALVPSQSEAILGLNVSNGLSRLVLHYKTPTATNLTKVFIFGTGSFTNIKTDRTGTDLAGAQPYQSVDPANGLRYIQSGSPVITKLDLAKFYEFADADTLKNVIINSAQLVINGVESPAGLESHNNLILRIMGSNNQFINTGIAADRTAMAKYYVVSTGRYFNAGSDPTSGSQAVASLAYSSENKTFSGYTTFFFQSLFNNRKVDEVVNPSRIQYLAMYPLAPAANSSVNRSVFHKDNIKLKIYYTRPTGVNP